MPNPKKFRGGKIDLAAVAEKRRQALELRKAGVGYEQIALKVGYSGPGAAYREIHAALREITREPAEELRTLETERLDRMLMGLWEKARAGDLKTVDRVLRIMERRSRLLGLDAPERKDVTSDGQPLGVLGYAVHPPKEDGAGDPPS